MAQLTRIGTNGYRGPGTEFQFLPAGEYEVGTTLSIAEHTVPRKMAEYLVSIGLAWVAGVQQDEPDPPPFDEAEPDEVGEGTEALDTEWDADTLEALTVDELRELAAGQDIVLPDGYIKKADLIALLLNA